MSFVVHRTTVLKHVYAAHPQLVQDVHAHVEKKPEVAKVPWELWGKTGTRWIDGYDLIRGGPAGMAPWFTTTAGQREAFMRSGNIIVRDYNPHAVDRALREKRRGVFDDMNDRRRVVTVVTKPSRVSTWKSMFGCDESDALPFVEVVSKTVYGYDGILMDERHLIGVVLHDGSEPVSLVFR